MGERWCKESQKNTSRIAVGQPWRPINHILVASHFALCEVSPSSPLDPKDKMKLINAVSGFAFLVSGTLGCGDCNAPQNEVVQTRLVRRMQPDAQNSSSGPKAPLEWGQINFLQTTDSKYYYDL
jgi:hypothetical protein